VINNFQTSSIKWRKKQQITFLSITFKINKLIDKLTQVFTSCTRKKISKSPWQLRGSYAPDQ